MRAYLTQDQIIRRERLKKTAAAVVLGGGLTVILAALLADNRSIGGQSDVFANDIALRSTTSSHGFIAASPGDENFRKTLEGGEKGGSVGKTLKSLFLGKPKELPTFEVSENPYGAAVAANTIQSKQTIRDYSTPVDEFTVVADGAGSGGRLSMGVNRTGGSRPKVPYHRISVGQPDVADVNPIGPTSLLVTAKKFGATELIIWDDQDQSQTVAVDVAIDLEALREQIKKTFPAAAVEVDAMNGAIALRGTVPSIQVADQIAAMAAPFSDKVLNFLEVSGGQQVMLQVKFLEMSRKASEELGINLGASLVNDGNFNIAFNGPNAGSKLSNGALTTIGGSATWDSFTLDYALSALKQNSLARVLAEPNVTVISGQEASLLAGGEFPVPVPQTGSGGGSTITIEYREFGVRLNVVPVVLGGGRIRLKCAPEVSDLDFSSPVVIENNNIPIINKRRIESTVEMNDGQTFAIAGLMRSTVTASRNATPLLGELPVVGALFRSVRYQREETELVVLVTPMLVEPMNPAEVPELSGEYWRHPNPVEFYLNGEFGGPAKSSLGEMPNDKVPARFRGAYGFAPATETASVEK